tara:strand:- start:3092 stop:3892 length:801 start_codon:yes stop_codon:yes gene_type:complete
MSKITFYPKIALRYFYELIIKFIKFLINFLANIGLIIIGILVLISLLSYSKFDSSLNTSSDDLVNNLVSSPGSYTSDLLVQMFGLSSIVIPISLIIIGFFSLTNRSQKTIKVISLLFLCLVTLSFASHMVSQSGGVFGFLINNQFMFLVNFLEIEIDSYLKNILIAIFATISLILGNNALLPNKRFKVKEIKKEVDSVEEKPKQVRIISKETRIKPIKKDEIKPKEKKLVKIKSNQIGYELPSLELLKEANEDNQTVIPDNLIERK